MANVNKLAPWILKCFVNSTIAYERSLETY